MRIMTCCKTNNGELKVQVMSAFANKMQITFFPAVLNSSLKKDIDTRESLLIAIELGLLFECSKIFGSQIGAAYTKSAAVILSPSFSLCSSSKTSVPAAGIAQLIIKNLQICLYHS